MKKESSSSQTVTEPYLFQVHMINLLSANQILCFGENCQYSFWRGKISVIIGISSFLCHNGDL